MKNNALSFSLLILMVFGFLLITSCSKEEERVEKQIIFDNETLIISYDCDDSNVNFLFDVIDDFTNAIDGTWPELDLYRVYFDNNNNGILDEGIDFLLSPNGSEICYSSLISQTSNSACSYSSEVTGTENFGVTENLNQDHVYYQLTVPKNLFSSSSKVNFALHIRDSETGWSYYPITRNPTLFDLTFEITW